MMQRTKTIMGILVLMLIALHFTLIYSFINPIKKAEGRWHYYAMYYLYPFFDQGWNLFAPAPRSNYHVYVNYLCDGKTQKFDLIQQIQSKHATNRLGGYETLSLAISNAIHNFEYGTALKKNMNGPIINDINYQVVQHFVNAYVNGITHNKARNISFFLLIQHVNTDKHWVYF